MQTNSDHSAPRSFESEVKTEEVNRRKSVVFCSKAKSNDASRFDKVSQGTKTGTNSRKRPASAIGELQPYVRLATTQVTIQDLPHLQTGAGHGKLRLYPNAGLQDTMALLDKTADVVEQIQTAVRTMENLLHPKHDKSLVDELCHKFEKLLVLMFHMSVCTDWKQMVAPLHTYLSDYLGGSLLRMFQKEVKHILCQCAEDDESALVLTPNSNWFSSNWERITKGALGGKIKALISILVMVGFMPKNPDHPIGKEAYAAFSVAMVARESESFIGYMCSCLDYVVDSVVPFVTTGDYVYLLGETEYKCADDMMRKAIDMCNMLSSGMHTALKEKHGMTTEAEVLAYIMNATLTLETLRTKCSKQDVLYKTLTAHLIRLDKLGNDIQACWHDSTLREKPFAAFIRGPSSVGKSSLAANLIHTVARVMGYPEGKEYIVSINGSDKYQSEFKSSHMYVIFDDMGNTRPEKCETNPLFILIQFINNIHCAALSPEAEKKGKNDIRSKVVVVTSNTRDLHATYFSVNTSSIMRRFDVIIDVDLKPEAVGPTGGMHKKYAGVAQPDAWDLVISHVVVTRGSDDKLADKWHTEEQCRGGILELINHLKKVCPDFYAVQKKIVEGAKDMSQLEHCKAHPEFVVDPVHGCLQCMHDFRQNQDVAFLPFALKNDDTSVSEIAPLTLCPNGAMDYIPWRSCDAAACDSETETVIRESPKERMRRLVKVGYISISGAYKNVKETVGKHPVLAAFAAVAATVSVCLLWNNATSDIQLDPEGALMSRITAAAKDPKNLVPRDGKYAKPVVINQLQYPQVAKTSKFCDLEDKIDLNLCVVTLQQIDPLTGVELGGTRWCNIFPLANAKWATVAHMFEEHCSYTLHIQHVGHKGAKFFNARVDHEDIKRVPGRDIVILELAKGGDTLHLHKYMFASQLEMDAASLVGQSVRVYRVLKSNLGSENVVLPSSYALDTKITGVQEVGIDGVGTYREILYEGDGFDGMCGGLVVLKHRFPTVIGMHNASRNGICGAVPLTADVLDVGLSKERVNILENSRLSGEVYGKPYTLSEEVHFRSPMHYLEQDENHNFELYGQHDMPTAKFSSSIKPSIIKEKLEILPDFVDKHGAPPKDGARPSFRRHLVNATKEKPCIRQKYLKCAVEDMKESISKVLESDKFKERVHIIDYDTALNGKPGVKGFDPVNAPASMGWNWNMPKAMAMIANKHGGHLQEKQEEVDGRSQTVYYMEFDKEIADIETVIEESWQKFIEGTRMNTVFRENLKDETVTIKKIEAKKVRVFAGAQVHMVLMTRMLTLALINVMTDFPIDFECAVGADATGKDWGFFFDMFNDHGSGKCGDGDIGDFDSTAAPEFTLEAYSFVKYILHHCGFDDEALAAFDGIATECIYPIYEMDGVLWKAFGSVPSGHSLTVIINSIIVRLYLRYAYYAMHDVGSLGVIPLFKEAVLLLTYGDDSFFRALMETIFNMQTLADELGKIGVRYTDADKNRPTVPYKKFEDISFLKRTFKYHPVLKAVVGPLEKDSIFKSLAWSKKNTTEFPTAQLMAQKMEGALEEFFYHSLEDYAINAPLLQAIANETIDEQGHKVSDYFRMPSVNYLVDRFNKTTCRYPLAREIIGSPFPHLNLKPNAGHSHLLDEFKNCNFVEEKLLFYSSDSGTENEKQYIEHVDDFPHSSDIITLDHWDEDFTRDDAATMEYCTFDTLFDWIEVTLDDTFSFTLPPEYLHDYYVKLDATPCLVATDHIMFANRNELITVFRREAFHPIALLPTLWTALQWVWSGLNFSPSGFFYGSYHEIRRGWEDIHELMCNVCLRLPEYYHVSADPANVVDDLLDRFHALRGEGWNIFSETLIVREALQDLMSYEHARQLSWVVYTAVNGIMGFVPPDESAPEHAALACSFDGPRLDLFCIVPHEMRWLNLERAVNMVLTMVMLYPVKRYLKAIYLGRWYFKILAPRDRIMLIWLMFWFGRSFSDYVVALMSFVSYLVQPLLISYVMWAYASYTGDSTPLGISALDLRDDDWVRTTNSVALSLRMGSVCNFGGNPYRIRRMWKVLKSEMRDKPIGAIVYYIIYGQKPVVFTFLVVERGVIKILVFYMCLVVTFYAIVWNRLYNV